MGNYILFAWQNYEAHGGAEDMLGRFDSAESARGYFDTLNSDYFDSANILNLDTINIDFYFHCGFKKWFIGSIEEDNRTEWE